MDKAKRSPTTGASASALALIEGAPVSAPLSPKRLRVSAQGRNHIDAPGPASAAGAVTLRMLIGDVLPFDVVLNLTDLAKIADALRPLMSTPTAQPVANLYCTVQEVAHILRYSVRHVRRLIARGVLQPVRVAEGGSARVLIERAAVERILGQVDGGRR